METGTAKKQSNRAIQRTHSTYKKKAEISEALNLVRPYLNVTTYKFLAHFLHTDGTGVTQIKISEWCKKVGVSLGSYNKTVKPEIENTFSQSLIIKTKAPMKMDKSRKTKVQASEFKSLLPLSVIKHIIRAKEAEEQQREQEKFWNQIEPEIIESEIEGEIEGEIEPIEPIPCGSKDEVAFQLQQNNSFREKHLEKDYLNNKSTKKNDSHSKPAKKFGLKKEVKILLDDVQANLINDQIAELSEEQKQEFGNRIQIFLKKYDLNINDKAIYDMIWECCYTPIQHDSGDLYGYFYKSMENGLFDFLLVQNGVNIEEYIEDREFDELNELREQAKAAYSESKTALMELAATIQPKPKKQKAWNNKKKPIRTEFIPEWFDKPYKAPERTKEQETELAIKQVSFMEKLAAFRNGAQNHL